MTQMEQYISKAALVAEIRELREHEIKWMERQGFTHYRMGERDAYTRILKFIDTLKVKEVDLEKEIQMFSMDLAMKENNGDWEKDIAVTARHFFELGLKVQKGE